MCYTSHWAEMRLPRCIAEDWTDRNVTTSDSSLHATPRPRRRGAHLLSTLLFIAAIGFAGAAVYLYVTEDEAADGPPPPAAAEPGRNEAANVMAGLKEAGLEPKYGRYSVETDQLSQPGQTIELGEHNFFIFIYPDADGQAAIAAREADAADVDPATMTLQSRSAERPLGEGEELHVFQGSNIVGVLVGGDDDLVQKVQDVIESLP